MSARLGVFALLGSLLGTAPLLAQDSPAAVGGEQMTDVERARYHFRAGVELYREGDLAPSLIEFKRAYMVAPNYRVLYNLAQVSQELREYSDAKRYYERYLREGGENVDAARKQEVAAALVKVRSRIAELVLSSSVADAEFFVDDVSLGKAPFAEPVLVNAGSHRVSAAAPGHVRNTKLIDAAGGETVPVTLELPPIEVAQAGKAPAAPAATASSKPPEPAAGSNPAMWFGIGTGVLAASAGILSVLAARDGAYYRETLERKTTPRELDDLHDRAAAKALAADILWVATTISAGLTLYFVFRDDGTEERPGASARLDLGPGHVQLRGAF